MLMTYMSVVIDRRPNYESAIALHSIAFCAVIIVIIIVLVRYILWPDVCPSGRPSHAGIVSKKAQRIELVFCTQATVCMYVCIYVIKLLPNH